jgi:hypothetical protein
LLLLLLLLLLCLGGILYYLFRRDDGTPAAGASATAAPGTSQSVTTPATTGAPATTGGPATGVPPVVTTPPGTAGPTVSPGPGAGTIDVPNVVGMKADQAEAAVKAKGFTKVTFRSENNTPVQILADWTVTAQTPKGGDKTGADTEIILTVKSTEEQGGGKG